MRVCSLIDENLANLFFGWTLRAFGIGWKSPRGPKLTVLTSLCRLRRPAAALQRYSAAGSTSESPFREKPRTLSVFEDLDLSKHVRFKRVLFLIIDAWFARTRRITKRGPFSPSCMPSVAEEPIAGPSGPRTTARVSPRAFTRRRKTRFETIPATRTTLEAPVILLVSTFPLGFRLRGPRDFFSKKRWRTTRFTTCLPASASPVDPGKKAFSRLLT